MKNRWWLIGLSVLGVVTHLFFLSTPRQVVFDEVHFGKFVTAYCCTHERFFDIHPPHAKLLVAGTSYLFGYRGGFDFDHIGEPYSSIPIFALRFFPALTGIALPVIFFILLRQLGASTWMAGFGSIVVALENALLVQTRLIALDGTLLVATFGSLTAFLIAQKKTGWHVILYTTLAGALAGLAVGTKFTGLAIVLLLGLIQVYTLVRYFSLETVKKIIIQTLCLAVGFIVIYATGWALHFMLLTQPGSGDAWRIPQWNRPIISSFVTETVAMHRLMFDANYNLTATHPFSSSWWMWLIMKKPVFYWQGLGQQAIYFIGNPVVWWGSTVLLITAILSLIRHPKEVVHNYRWIPWAGFLISLGPMIRIPRALFMYHYLTPLLFAILIGVLWLDAIPIVKKSFVRWGLVGAVVVGFLIMLPLTYGFSAPAWWMSIAQLMV